MTSQDPVYGHFEFKSGYSPGVGSTHRYTLLWNASANGYDLWYDTALVITRPASYALVRTFCGGEASTDQNGMGTSGCLHNQYASTSSGGWTYDPYHYDYADPGYFVADLSASDWQIGGNN